MTYAESFRYDARTVIVHTRDHTGDWYFARDVDGVRVAEGASLHAAVGRLRGGR